MDKKLSLPALFVIALLASGCRDASYSSVPYSTSGAASSSPGLPIDSTQPAELSPSSAVSIEPTALSGNSPPMYVADGSEYPERKELPIKHVTFDDLKFDIKKDSKFEPSMLTPKIEELVGRRIRIRGFIFPPPQQTVSVFVLTRDNLECCFGPGAVIYDCIFVVMAADKSAEYSTHPVTVEGALTLRERLDFEGINTESIFYLEAEGVK